MLLIIIMIFKSAFINNFEVSSPYRVSWNNKCGLELDSSHQEDG
jgi:hypothetical protein